MRGDGAVFAALFMAGCASKSAGYCASLRFTVPTLQSFTRPANCRGSACLGCCRCRSRTTGQPSDQGCRGNHRGCAHRLARAISFLSKATSKMPLNWRY